jgi:DNA-binding NtrC family response regulator
VGDASVTAAIPASKRGRFRVRRAKLTALDGPDAGKTWQVDRDCVGIGSLGDIALADPTVSRRHAEIVRTPDGTLLRDLGSTNGTWVGGIKVREVFLAADTSFRVGRTGLRFDPVDELVDVEPSAEPRFGELVGMSPAMREVFAVLERVSPTDLTVLVTGETGTGKELASRAVHERSLRARGPFVVFDCGAAPANLVESELFGHQKGAFTGAVEARAGVFEVADGGTIFLDEIGELPLELQPKLLRVLERREVRRIGANHAKPVDVRIVAATNRRLREEVAAGRFREDLYYRLAVVELTLPPVRERREDLPVLVAHLIGRANRGSVRGIAPAVRELFASYAWPGNVRELANVIERALPFCDGETISLEALPDALRAAKPTLAPPQLDVARIGARPFKDAKDEVIDLFERQYVIDLIDRHGGNISRAARTADMDRKSIARLMRKHGLTRY